MARSPNPGRQTFCGERYTIVVGGSTINVKTESGRLFRLLIVAPGNGVFDVWDDPAANNNRVYSRAAATEGEIIEMDCPMEFGIRVTTGTGVIITAIYT